MRTRKTGEEKYKEEEDREEKGTVGTRKKGTGRTRKMEEESSGRRRKAWE